ncbi:unnamed protein product, partial [Timema podura]|nr:unnamed protein product [Timema podura]
NPDEDVQTLHKARSFPPSFLNTCSCRTGNNHRATHLVTHQEPEPLERRDEPTRDGSEVSDETLVTRAQSVVVNALRWLFQSLTSFRREAVTCSDHVDGRLTAEMFKATNPSGSKDLNHPSTSYYESQKSSGAFNPPSTSQDKDPDDDNYFKVPPPAPNDDFK